VPSLKDLAAENEWSMVAEYNAADQQAAKQAGVQYIDPFPWFCSSVCTAVIGNMAVYAKANHISLEYATFLSGALQEALRPAMSSEGR